MHPDEKLVEILQGLVEQVYALGQRQIAMECVSAALLAQVAFRHPDPSTELSRMTAELGGCAMGVADQFKMLGLAPNLDTRNITLAIETVTKLSEDSLANKIRGYTAGTASTVVGIAV